MQSMQFRFHAGVSESSWNLEGETLLVFREFQLSLLTTFSPE